MEKDELLCYLVPMMDADPDYQQALQKLEKVEPEYLALLETLTPEQQDVLERYITACEEVVSRKRQFRLQQLLHSLHLISHLLVPRKCQLLLKEKPFFYRCIIGKKLI